MLHKIVFFLSLFTVSLFLGAQTVQVNPDHPDQYTVQEGDTLWDISGEFLVDPWRWPEIWQVNSQINDPHLIYPGDVIRLSYDGESPILTVNRASNGGRFVKLSPSIRENERDRAIYTIPIDVIRQFLTRPLTIGENEMDDWPYIVSSYEQHLVASPGVEIYVRGLDASSISKKYAIYRKGPEYISKSGGSTKTLGYEAMFIGEAQITAYGDPSTAMITSAVKEAMIGDRLIEQTDDEIFTNFIPSSPDSTIIGSIISAEGVLTEIGQYQVIVLDKGSADGVEVSNVFGVFQKGSLVNDKVMNTAKSPDDSDLIDYLGKSKSRGVPITLPEVRAGVILVFRTFEQVSYALVMEALTPIHINDSFKGL
ncbi:MAG: hypothetical protein ACI9XC_001055 [Gammaproteobacteria bacterium]|jgi:hypothetical protein